MKSKFRIRVALLLFCLVAMMITGCSQDCCEKVAWSRRPTYTTFEPIIHPCDVCPAIESSPVSEALVLAETRPFDREETIITSTTPEGMEIVTSYAPPSCIDIVDTALKTGKHDTFVTAVQAAALEDTLRGDGPFTVFAPTDIAFSKLPNGKLEWYLRPENVDDLEELLQYHIVPGKYSAADLRRMESVTNLDGYTLQVSECPSCFNIEDSKIILADVYTCNGVIHYIDEVLIPETE